MLNQQNDRRRAHDRYHDRRQAHNGYRDQRQAHDRDYDPWRVHDEDPNTGSIFKWILTVGIFLVILTVIIGCCRGAGAKAKRGIIKKSSRKISRSKTPPVESTSQSGSKFTTALACIPIVGTMVTLCLRSKNVRERSQIMTDTSTWTSGSNKDDGGDNASAPFVLQPLRQHRRERDNVNVNSSDVSSSWSIGTMFKTGVACTGLYYLYRCTRWCWGQESLSARGSKYALLVGCSNVQHGELSTVQSYNTSNKVQGCLLDTELGFQITRLSDSPAFCNDRNAHHPAKYAGMPSADNVKKELRSMLRNAQPGDTCVFVYQGHGDYGWDLQANRMRQFLCCIGGNNDEYVGDTDLHAILNEACAGVKILVLLDCCHAGYIASQPYRLNSSWKPKPVGSGSKGERFLARYNAWKNHGGWYDSDFHSGRKQHNRPFIISIAASEFDEASWDMGRIPSSEHSNHPTRAEDKTGVFSVRMMTYFFGDWEKDGHFKDNANKTIGQQFYMALDSNKLQNVGSGEGQHAVLTSNQRFDTDSFGIWDFISGDFYQDWYGNYHLQSNSWERWNPWNWF